MIKLLESLGAGKGSFAENGQYLALFLVALLFLWLLGEEKRKEFKVFAFVVGLLLLCPLTAKLLTIYQSAFYDYETVWVWLPLTAVVAYAMVVAAEKMLSLLTREDREWKETISGKKEKLYEGAVIGTLAVLLFLSGTVSLTETVTEKASRADGIPKEVGEVLDLIEIPQGESILLAAPDEVVAWARIYDGDIVLFYGRDMTETALTAYLYDKYPSDIIGLHDWVHGTLPAPALVEEAYLQEETYVEQCLLAGCDYLIFTVERANNDLLAYALESHGGYAIIGRTDNYVVYSR